MPRVTDPIFGLSYDPAKVKFEELGSDIIARCPELTNARYGRRMWLFARTTEASGTYVVLGGLYERRDQPAKSRQRFETDPNGVLLREHDSKCELIGPAREVFDYPVDGITAPTLQALARDAARRYADAFGSNEKFLAAVKSAKADLANPRSGILRDAIEQLR